WESLAVGAAVIVCDAAGSGPLVTLDQLPLLKRANFGRRLLCRPIEQKILLDQIDQFNAADASEVSRQIRATSSVQATVDQLVACYREVISAHAATPGELDADVLAAGKFLRDWGGRKSILPKRWPTDQAAVLRVIELEQNCNKLFRDVRKAFRTIQNWLPRM